MLYYISLVALVISAVSFILFVYFLLRGPAPPPPAGLDAGVQHGAPGEFAKLAEALAKLVQSLQKAGPATLCLFSSLFFIVVALVAART